MAVRANQRFSRAGKTLQMNLMANAVAGARITHADFFCNRADEAMIVGVHESVLQSVVVDISHTQLSFDTGNSHGFVL